MEIRVRVKNHPVHPMLISLPIGLWVFSFVCDLIYLFSSNSKWEMLALYTLVGGTIGGILAAVPGLIDYWGIKNAEAEVTATKHGILNGLLILVSFPDILMRLEGLTTFDFPIILSAIMMVILAISGWLGGKLVFEQGVSVKPYEMEFEAPKPPREEKMIAAEEFKEEELEPKKTGR